MSEENNLPYVTGLSMNAGVDALLGNPSTSEEPKRSPDEGEVTKSEETVKAEEAAVTEPQRPTVDPDEQPTEEAESEDETKEDEPDGDESDEEESEEEDTDEDSEGSDEDTDDDADQDPVFALEDGTEVNLDELKRGYLRQSDYTKKTQELAEGRKQLVQMMESRQQERQTLAENLNLAMSVVEPQLAELAKVDWDQLAQTDAYEYAEKRALWDQASARYNNLHQQAQALVQKQQQEAQAARQQKLKAERQKLNMAIPDMADPQKAKQLNASLKQYAMASGLSEQEAAGISDHRMVVMMHKAMQFDQLQSGELKAAKKKLTKSPKRALKGGKPVTQAERQQRARSEKLGQVRKGGQSATDAAVDLLLMG